MPVEPPRRLKLLQQQQVFPRLLGLQIAGSGRAKLNLKLQQQAVHGRPRPMRPAQSTTNTTAELFCTGSLCWLLVADTCWQRPAGVSLASRCAAL